MSVERQGDAVSKHLANVMKEMGWTRPENVIRIGGKACRGFTKVIEQRTDAQRILIERLKQQMVPLVPLAVAPPALVVKRRKL